MKLLIVIIGWIACGVISYAMRFAYFQREYPTLAAEQYSFDMCSSILFALLGPANLIAAIIFCCMFGFHGFKFR